MHTKSNAVDSMGSRIFYVRIGITITCFMFRTSMRCIKINVSPPNILVEIKLHIALFWGGGGGVVNIE